MQRQFDANANVTLQIQDIAVELMKKDAVAESNQLPEAKDTPCSPGAMCATKVYGTYKNSTAYWKKIDMYIACLCFLRIRRSRCSTKGCKTN